MSTSARALLFALGFLPVALPAGGGSLCDEAQIPDRRNFPWCWSTPSHDVLIDKERPQMPRPGEEASDVRWKKYDALRKATCAQLTARVEETYADLRWFKCYIRSNRDGPDMILVDQRVGLRIGTAVVWATEWHAPEGPNECALAALPSGTHLLAAWLVPGRSWRSGKGSIKTWIAFPRRVETDGGTREWELDDVTELVVETLRTDRSQR